MMRTWDSFYPEYGLANHKGYHAPEHIAALRKFGPTPQHRLSFDPIGHMAFFSPLASTQLEMFPS